MVAAVYLGPPGATFSYEAYQILARRYQAPSSVEHGISAGTNGEILPLVEAHKGYGVIAMETLAGGRVAETLESFIALLSRYGSARACPFQILGAVRMPLNFCLMAQPRILKEDLRLVLAHAKAFDACRRKIASIPTRAVASNGEAARVVYESSFSKKYAALAPRAAAQKYALQVLEDHVEDEPAVTTFFLVGPAERRVPVGKENRALVVCKLRHTPGALVEVLEPFKEERLNLIQVHSMHTGSNAYDFGMEIEARENELPQLARALAAFEKRAAAHLIFGPFEVQSA